MDSIITKGMSVREFKKQIIKEAYNQGVEYPLQLDRYTSQGVFLSLCRPLSLSPVDFVSVRRRGGRPVQCSSMTRSLKKTFTSLLTLRSMWSHWRVGGNTLARVLLIATRGTNIHMCY